MPISELIDRLTAVSTNPLIFPHQAFPTQPEVTPIGSHLLCSAGPVTEPGRPG